MELEAAVKASKETMASYKQRCEGLEDALAKIESEKQRFAEEVEILSKRIDEKHAVRNSFISRSKLSHD